MSEFPAPPRVHVMHVPGADRDRDEIVAKLSREADACVHEDRDRDGLMPNWISVLNCAADHDGEQGWTVILSDDALPLRGWQQHLERACLNSPHPALGLTHFGAYGRKALERGTAYAEGKYLLWGGAVALRREFCDGLGNWARYVYARTRYPHDDVLACAYAMKRGTLVAMAARAIFGQPVKASLLGHNTPIREPATTIENTGGPSYRRLPRATPVSRTCSPKGELERLAAL